MIFRIKSFLRYILRSTNKHGVHPPFIFDLVSNVIESKKHYYAFDEIEALRKSLLNDNRTVEIEDLGAKGNGEVKNTSVNRVASQSLKRTKHAQLLFRLINYFKPSNILELGTSLGITTLYLSKASGTSNVTTIEGSENIAKIAQDNFKKLNANNITSIVGDFETALPDFIHKSDTIDFVFIDGNHRKEATLRYFNLLLPKLPNNAVVVFDDIYWSQGMAEAWEKIKKHDRVTSTIDLFEMGIVFLKEGLAKQHFSIRY